jgi:hypothetical protein
MGFGAPTFQQKQAAGAVIAELNNVMHDTKNMLRMKDLFVKFDKDRNGFISMAEFKLVIGQFSQKITNKQIELVVPFFDRNGDGQLEYGEFAKLLMSHEFEQYRPLAVHEEAPKTVAEHTQKRQEAILLIQQKRIRLERSNSIADNNLKLQGNLEHYSIKSLQKRDNLKRNEFVKQEIMTFWDSIDMIKDENGNINKATYITFNIKLQLGLVEGGVTEEEGMAEAEADWVKDSVEGEYMSYSEFSKSMFELADMWVDSIGEHTCCCCLLPVAFKTTCGCCCVCLGCLCH